jgi:hypothetical protein
MNLAETRRSAAVRQVIGAGSHSPRCTREPFGNGRHIAETVDSMQLFPTELLSFVGAFRLLILPGTVPTGTCTYFFSFFFAPPGHGTGR